MQNQKFKRGFTLLELTITISIITLLGTLGLVSFINSRNVRELATQTQNLVSLLRLAQARTLAGDGNAPWGIHLTQNSYTLFRGPSFAAASFTENYPVPQNLELVDTALAGGGPDVIFKRITGETDTYGTFTVRVQSNHALASSIRIDPSGKVFQTSSVGAITGTRIVDARHREFALGWTIKNSTTLVLTFSDPPNPNTIKTIAMNPPAPRAAFDWSDTVTVGGQKQMLRVHAAALTDADTILRVDRDCRKNTKRVKIEIDAKHIATFEEDCRTITIGSFGGIMTEP